MTLDPKVTSSTAIRPAQRTNHIGLALLALALGGFAIGTTEFMSMGLLPDIADSIHRSNATTGHIITAYAFGVVVGAPVIVSLGAALPRRELAIGLILTLGLGNAITAVAQGYLPVLLARFVSGLPHGAYFGVASLLAASLVPPAQRGRAISMVMLGLSVATVAGVPGSTLLGQNLGWRSAYWLVLVLSVAAAAMIWVFVPHQPANRDATVRSELVALRRSQVWFAMSAGVVGFGGMFAMYTFINPIITDVTGQPESAVSLYLLIFGVGSVIGAWAAGPLSDWSPARTVVLGFAATAIALVVFYSVASYAVPTGLMVFVVGALGSVLAISLQVRLMAAAGAAEMLGAALNHSALNVANGLGALFGSVVIDAGYGYRSTSLVGAGLAAAGVVVFVLGLAFSRRSRGVTP